MPYVKMLSSAAISPEIETELLHSLSSICATILAKPEQYVMASVDQGAMCMSGKDEPAAFVELRSIGGLTPERKQQLSAEISARLKQTLGLPSERVYLNFVDVKPGDWGYNGGTFG